MGGLTTQQAISLYSCDNPFAGADAYAHSNYSMYQDGALLRLLDWREPSAQAKLAHNAFRAYVLSDCFSCVAAKAAVQSGGYRFAYYRDMDEPAAAAGLARDLCAFSTEFAHIDARYKTFVSVFGNEIAGERAFEESLWKLLTRLRVLDQPFHAWDPAVSSDPADPRFAFSFAGIAFFVVGLHPRSSRVSRRFARPAIAFNAHSQFEALRETGRFGRIRAQVRGRELQLQASLNPNLADFGERSEARQYSGRPAGDDWRCPFHKA